MDPFMNVFKQYVAPTHHKKVSLMFIQNNNHVYPILEKNLQNKISKAKEWKFDNIKFNVHTYNYHKINKYIVSNNILDDGIAQNYNNDEYDQLVAGLLPNDKVYVIEDSLEDVATDIIKKTGYIDIAMNIRNGEVLAFRHPVNHAIIQCAPDYDSRKFICERLFQIFPYNCFLFTNQSYNTIVQNLFKVVKGVVPKSYNVKEDEYIFDNFSTKPLINTLIDNYEKTETFKGFDIQKSYSNAVINMKYDYPVYNICDTFQKYNGDDIVCGEYIIDNITIKQLGCIPF